MKNERLFIVVVSIWYYNNILINMYKCIFFLFFVFFIGIYYVYDNCYLFIIVWKFMMLKDIVFKIYCI